MAKQASSVLVVDDSYRRNRCTQVDKDNQASLEAILKTVLKVGTYLPMRDDFGRMVQETVELKTIYTGRHLEVACLRAKRALRSARVHPSKVAGHVGHKILAFAKADPDGFKKFMGEAV